MRFIHFHLSVVLYKLRSSTICYRDGLTDCIFGSVGHSARWSIEIDFEIYWNFWNNFARVNDFKTWFLNFLQNHKFLLGLTISKLDFFAKSKSGIRVSGLRFQKRKIRVYDFKSRILLGSTIPKRDCFAKPNFFARVNDFKTRFFCKIEI